MEMKLLRFMTSNAQRRRLRNPSAILALVTAIPVASIPLAQGQTFSTLYTFTGGTDGATPNGLTRDAAGNLYGTTYEGGTGPCNDNHFPGCGVVFKVTKSGTETVLYSFTGRSTGAFPTAPVIRDSQGTLHGTTFYSSRSGYGTIFQLDKMGKKIMLHRFTGPPDGANPYAGLIQDASGALYGTTEFGGEFNGGVVFQFKAGKVGVLHSFAGSPDGANPYSGLVQDVAGNFYGTTGGGGAYGHGTVFRMTKAGDMTVLYSFAGYPTDGDNPSEVIRDTTGNLYGTTGEGGAYDWGTVFKLDTNGVETILHSFNLSDGAFPGGRLVRDGQGNLYGTTSAGGIEKKTCNVGCGVVFKVTATGKETTLHLFDFANGANPTAGLIRDAQGNLYGTTPNNHAGGTVFKITP